MGALQFRGVGHIAPQIAWHMPLHRHADFHELILVLRGRLETHICGERWLGKRGDLFYYPAGEPHREQAQGRDPLETFFIAWHGPPMMAGKPCVLFDRQHRIEHQMTWLAEVQPDDPNAPATRLALLTTILSEYQRLAANPAHDLVLEVRRYMRGALAEPLCLEQIAVQVGLSPFHFARRFRTAAGVTPMNYLRKLRVEVAQDLLLRTALPLKEIAAQTGFADVYHFSRVFRQTVGQPPGAFRKDVNAE